MVELNLKPGLRCKACDAPLNADLDTELCIVCLEVVADANADFYAELDILNVKEEPEDEEEAGDDR